MKYCFLILGICLIGSPYAKAEPALFMTYTLMSDCLRDQQKGIVSGCGQELDGSITGPFKRPQTFEEQFDQTFGVSIQDSDASAVDPVDQKTGQKKSNSDNLNGAFEGVAKDPASQKSNSSGTTPISNESASDIVDEFKTSQCKEQISKTETCCQHPEQCIGGGDGNGSSAIYGSIQAILGAAGNAAALSGSCGKMRNIGAAVTAMNFGMAGICTNKINQCKNACADIAQRAKVALDANPNLLSGTKSELRKVANSKGQCSENENYAAKQADQAVASALTTKLMDLCKNATTSPTTNPNAVALNNLNIDCSSASNAANPACQNQCNRAGAENDPACKSMFGGGFTTSNQIGGNGLVNPDGKTNGDGAVPDEFENGQDAAQGNFTPTASRVASSSPAGGGANLGNGSDSGGGLGGGVAGASGNGDGGLDPSSVNSGFRSGSGYVSSSGRSVASTGGGSFSYFPREKADNGRPFNPKDYLPGGRLDPRRKLAGLGAPSSDIGAVHGDIFKNITNRFYQVCLRDGLMDCETVRKSSRIGN